MDAQLHVCYPEICGTSAHCDSRPVGTGSVMLWAISSQKIRDPTINVVDSSTCTTYLSVVAEQVHPSRCFLGSLTSFTSTICPNLQISYVSFKRIEFTIKL